jgi:hypothetical protein
MQTLWFLPLEILIHWRLGAPPSSGKVNRGGGKETAPRIVKQRPYPFKEPGSTDSCEQPATAPAHGVNTEGRGNKRERVRKRDRGLVFSITIMGESKGRGAESQARGEVNRNGTASLPVKELSK